ncbi:serine hydrolase domain-containing protein [Luteipulveratus mongoliensis]|uniref:serine hydrolase domain-containing protein n=1 Tax=Luteipulveratus mongoliensis TaxID=571913 RepID=UPI00146FE3C8|nr:serine hydrolase domain-containing protein [Luteipulveratus mongoliensis]
MQELISAIAAPGAVLATSTKGQHKVEVAGVTDRDSGTSVTPETPFRIASLTKTLTSAATVLTARAAGRSLDEPLAELMPELVAISRAATRLTLADLLAQVSGLRESVDSDAVAALGDGDDALASAARLVIEAGRDEAPGERWSYYNGNYFLAGAALARLAGSSYEDALQQHVLKPWGLTATGFATPDGAALGHEGDAAVTDADYPRSRRPSGGLWSTATDLLQVGERLLADEALLAATREPRTPESSTTTYGLGWAIGPSGQMYVNGRLTGFRAVLLAVPEDEFVAVGLANHEDALPTLAHAVSALQQPHTGDDIAKDLDAFAA